VPKSQLNTSGAAALCGDKHIVSHVYIGDMSYYQFNEQRLYIKKYTEEMKQEQFEDR